VEITPSSPGARKDPCLIGEATRLNVTTSDDPIDDTVTVEAATDPGAESKSIVNSVDIREGEESEADRSCFLFTFFGLEDKNERSGISAERVVVSFFDSKVAHKLS
jgi:hypothetical protein